MNQKRQREFRKSVCRDFREFIESLDAVTYTSCAQYSWTDDGTLNICLSVRLNLSDPTVAHEYNTAIQKAGVYEEPTLLQMETTGSENDDTAEKSKVMRLTLDVDPDGIVAFRQ